MSGRPHIAGSSRAQRVGPVVAAVGVLGAVVTLLWLTFAPDNVVGPVDASSPVPARIVLPVEDDGCVRVVAGDAVTDELCVGDVLLLGTPAWTIDGTVAVDVEGGHLELDPDTGAVVPRAGQAGDDPDRRPGDAAPLVPRATISDDGGRVRRLDGGVPGETVLDLGSPVARLDQAVVSPDGRWVVAVDSRGRVLVADADRPAAPRVWTTLEERWWIDLDRAVRWER